MLDFQYCDYANVQLLFTDNKLHLILIYTRHYPHHITTLPLPQYHTTLTTLPSPHYRTTLTTVPHYARHTTLTTLSSPHYPHHTTLTTLPHYPNHTTTLSSQHYPHHTTFSTLHLLLPPPKLYSVKIPNNYRRNERYELWSQQKGRMVSILHYYIPSIMLSIVSMPPILMDIDRSHVYFYRLPALLRPHIVCVLVYLIWR